MASSSFPHPQQRRLPFHAIMPSRTTPDPLKPRDILADLREFDRRRDIIEEEHLRRRSRETARCGGTTRRNGKTVRRVWRGIAKPPPSTGDCAPTVCARSSWSRPSSGV
jgi:hypothetical protein